MPGNAETHSRLWVFYLRVGQPDLGVQPAHVDGRVGPEPRGRSPLEPIRLQLLLAAVLTTGGGGGGGGSGVVDRNRPSVPQWEGQERWSSPQALREKRGEPAREISAAGRSSCKGQGWVWYCGLLTCSGVASCSTSRRDQLQVRRLFTSPAASSASRTAAAGAASPAFFLPAANAPCPGRLLAFCRPDPVLLAPAATSVPACVAARPLLSRCCLPCCRGVLSPVLSSAGTVCPAGCMKLQPGLVQRAPCRHGPHGVRGRGRWADSDSVCSFAALLEASRRARSRAAGCTCSNLQHLQGLALQLPIMLAALLLMGGGGRPAPPPPRGLMLPSAAPHSSRSRVSECGARARDSSLDSLDSRGNPEVSWVGKARKQEKKKTSQKRRKD